LAVAGAAALYLAVNAWRNSRSLSEAEMLKRLPAADATVLSVDFAQLRHSGLFGGLAGSKAREEADYLAFVRDTGFDYKRDLDQALVSFAPTGTFFVVRGRFDWKKLDAYAKQSGGSCYNDLCHMPGSTPERRISFLPLGKGVMGMAVSTDELAASQLLHAGAQRALTPAAEPVWISIPNSALARSAGSLPASTRLITSAMTAANDIMFTLGARGSNYEARIEAQCRTAKDASNLAGQLTALTGLLKTAIEREKKTPDPNDLTGVLTAGVFRQADKTVYGQWTLRKSFLENLAGGM
jgi:hypothetical protein